MLFFIKKFKKKAAAMKYIRKFFHLLILSLIVVHMGKAKEFCPPFVHISFPSQHQSRDTSYQSHGNYHNSIHEPVYNRTNNASRSGWPASDISYSSHIDISPSISNRHGNSHSQHTTSHPIPSCLYDYNVPQLKQHFKEKGYSEQEILDLRLLYNSEAYVAIVKNYPGYAAAVEKRYNELKDLSRFKRAVRLLSRNPNQKYKVNLWKNVQALYKELQKQKPQELPIQQQKVLEQHYVHTAENQTIPSDTATTILSTIGHAELPIAHAELVHLEEQVTDIFKSENITDPIEQKDFLVTNFGMNITDRAQNTYKGRADHIHLVNNVAVVDVHSTTIDILNTHTDHASIGKELDTVAQQVLANAKLCNLDSTQEAEDLIIESLHVIRAPRSDVDFVFNVATVDCILGDIQSQVDGIIEGQPIVWERQSPELLQAVMDKVISGQDSITQEEKADILQACDSLIHTAYFTIDTTFGTSYLAPEVYQHRCDTFLNFLEPMDGITAESIINLSTKAAADFVFDQGFISTGAYLNELDAAIKMQTQISNVADTFKNAVETRLIENISDLYPSAQVQDVASQTSEVSNEQLQKNVVLPQKVLHVHETHVMNQLEQDWLSQKDTAYNSARLEERLDALNKVKVTQGLELDEQLHKELAESCSRMQELSRDFGHDRHVQMLSPFVHLRADQAARESNPIVAFELSDFCDMTTKALEHGMHVLYDAGCAVDKGIMSGIKHTFSIEHWKDMAMGSVQMGLSCAKVVVLDDLEKYCAAIIDLVPGSHAMKQLEERNQLQTQAQIKSAFELMSKTHDTLEKMSWQEIVENGSAIGTTMILDTLVFHAAGEFASVTSNKFIAELTKGAESGQLFTKEYLVEVAGVGKIAIEDGLETTATMFESMNEADSLTKNISKLSEVEALATSEGPIIKNTEGAANVATQQKVSKTGGAVAEEMPVTTSVVPKKGIIQNTEHVLEKIKKYEQHIFSPDHKKSGILAAGESQEAIMNSLYDIIIFLDKKELLIEGPNQIKAVIGGVQNMEIKCFIQNGEILSVNAYPSNFTRIYGNFIDSTKVLL